jgi:hypothetical protein
VAGSTAATRRTSRPSIGGLAVGAGLGDAGPGDLDGGDRRLARRRRPNLIDDRVRDRALVAGQHEVGPDAAGDGRRHRRLQAVGDHRGERHQADADHQGRRGRRRTAGRAGGVALAEAAGQTETGPGAHRQRHPRHHQHDGGRLVQAGEGGHRHPGHRHPGPQGGQHDGEPAAAHHPGQGAHQHHAEGGHTDEPDEGAEPEQRQPIAAVADDGDGDGRRPGHGGDRTEHDAQDGVAGRADGVIGDGDDRRDARRPPAWVERSEDGDGGAEQGDAHQAGGETTSGPGGSAAPATRNSQRSPRPGDAGDAPMAPEMSPMIPARPPGWRTPAGDAPMAAAGPAPGCAG